MLTKPADQLSQQIAEHARNAPDAETCEAMLADTREQLMQQLLDKHQTPGAAERIVDEIIGGARAQLVEILLGVQLGQLWEVYSVSEDRWTPSTVTDIDDDLVTLRAQDNQWHRCHRKDMRDRSHYRLVADLGQPPEQLVRQQG
ncbi:MAG TPA: hypothetical protein VKB68_03420 [Stellaceae bacterium]|nr:hypothetical protein [Stellaceae bacterium]